MLIADLRSMAGGMGIGGTAKMKKADLVAAIKAGQSGGGSAPAEQSAPAGVSQQKPSPEKQAPEKQAPEKQAPEKQAEDKQAQEKQAAARSAEHTSELQTLIRNS